MTEDIRFGELCCSTYHNWEALRTNVPIIMIGKQRIMHCPVYWTLKKYPDCELNHMHTHKVFQSRSREINAYTVVEKSRRR